MRGALQLARDAEERAEENGSRPARRLPAVRRPRGRLAPRRRAGRRQRSVVPTGRVDQPRSLVQAQLDACGRFFAREDNIEHELVILANSSDAEGASRAAPGLRRGRSLCARRPIEPPHVGAARRNGAAAGRRAVRSGRELRPGGPGPAPRAKPGGKSRAVAEHSHRGPESRIRKPRAFRACPTACRSWEMGQRLRCIRVWLARAGVGRAGGRAAQASSKASRSKESSPTPSRPGASRNV
jgi:hypothetical protein